MARTRSVAALTAKSVPRFHSVKTASVKVQKPTLGSKANVSGTEMKLEQKSVVASTSSNPIVSASSRKTKPHIETFFSHIEVPGDLCLPADFVTYHTPEFIEGVKYILSVDPSLYPATVHGNFTVFARENEPDKKGLDLINHYWFSLITSILGQQISGHAAKAIRGRFEQLFDGDPTPEATLKLPQETVKGVGLSNMKLKYVIHISETFATGDTKLLDPLFYESAPTTELIKELTLLKGVGEWSARMFCLFTLKDLDVFAYDDLGVARGVARYLEVRPLVLEATKVGVHADEILKAGLKKKGKFAKADSKRDWTPLHDEYMKFLAAKFQPYQLIFMLLMWRLSATNTEVLLKQNV